MAAQVALAEGDNPTAIRGFRTAIDLLLAADRPWGTLRPRATIGRLLLHDGDPVGAESELVTAYDLALRYPREDVGLGFLLIDLANAESAQGKSDAAIAHTSAAADWFDARGIAPMAANCRFGMAAWLHQSDRDADAVALIEESLPEFEEHLTPEALMRAHWMLGEALDKIDEPEQAAERLVVAAELAARHADPEARVSLAHDAAHALSRTGKHTEAERVFADTIPALVALGRIGDAVRMNRASAWNLIGANEPDKHDLALARFADATALLDSATRDVPGLDRARERAFTEIQTTQALWQFGRHNEALTTADRAAARLELGLPRLEEEYIQLVSMAARLEHRSMGLTAMARERIDTALTVTRMLGATTATAALTELREQLG
jgi:tetratricopeptide (TPR) repeat protein